MSHDGLEPFLSIEGRGGRIVVEELGHVESDRMVHALAEGCASPNWEPAIEGKIGGLGTVEAVVESLVVGYECFLCESRLSFSSEEDKFYHLET